MHRSFPLAVAAAGAILVAYLAYNHFDTTMVEAPVLEPATTTVYRAAEPLRETTEPVIRHPIPEPGEVEQTVEEPIQRAIEPLLPELSDSDGMVRETLSNLLGAEAFDSLFNPEHIIPRIAAAVDNLTREKVPEKVRPLKRVPGRFLTRGEEDDEYLSAENFNRYAPYVRVLESLNADMLAAQYIRLYPLFQRAFEELGYPDHYFNDRLVDVLDDLLASPDVSGPIRLVRPHVLYKFADPRLEALSAGQKIMVRMGPQNAARVKTKLQEIRRALSGKKAPG